MEQSVGILRRQPRSTQPRPCPKLHQLPVTVEACALPTRKCFQESVGDAAHLLNRIVNHAVPFNPSREANRNV